MSPIRIGIAGDTHGDTKDTINMLDEMGKRNIQRVYVVGDFGLWTHFFDGQVFLDDVQEAAKRNNLTVLAIGGNHENWDHWEWYVKNHPAAKGFAYIRSRILIAPKVHDFKLAGKQFVVAGGAVSIDRDYRLQRERGARDPMGVRTHRGTGPRTLYWDNEELTDQDVVNIQKSSPRADVLLTHDCSDQTAFEGRLKPDPASQRHRQRIDKVLEAVKPKVHFHGHMHTKYEWDNPYPFGYKPFDDKPYQFTKTYGLNCNPNAQWGGRGKDWWGILDVQTLQFAWNGEGMRFRSLEE